MKKSLFSRITLAAAAAFALVGAACARAFERVAPSPLQFSRQGGFVLLNRAYAGYVAGTIVELPASTEAAMILSGSAQASSGPPTPGAVSTTANSGCVGIAAAGISVVITHPNISVQSIIYAVISQAAADGTAFNVARVSVAAGAATIFLNAAATAAVNVDWAILNPNGSLSSPQ